MENQFKRKINEHTNTVEFEFGATITSINENAPQTYTNDENVEKTYYLGTVDFTYPNGQQATGVSTQIYQKSLDHGIEIGSKLLSTLSQGNEGRLYVRTSHLLYANYFDTDQLGGLSFDMVIGAEDTTAAATTAPNAATPPV